MCKTSSVPRQRIVSGSSFEVVDKDVSLLSYVFQFFVASYQYSDSDTLLSRFKHGTPINYTFCFQFPDNKEMYFVLYVVVAVAVATIEKKEISFVFYYFSI